jgi:uncharacterized RDD family membrane protein YckC
MLRQLYIYVGLKVLTAVVMKSFWDVTSCSPIKVAYFLLPAGFFLVSLLNPDDGGDMFL